MVNVKAAVARALAGRRPVVALESTLISHGLPWPDNLACAQALEAAVRDVGAEPATIALLNGEVHIGVEAADLERLARAEGVTKTSRRDIARIMASGGDGATTVAATMTLAARAGIRVFATGGIGGVHRQAETTFDISADLPELARTPVAVVCAGAKIVLDLPRTLEVLETAGVPVLGYGCDRLPAFYVRETDLPVARVDGADATAAIIARQLALGLGGLLVTVPMPVAAALPRQTVEEWLVLALAEAEAQHLRGHAVTPFLLSRLADLSEGRTLIANRVLAEHNARTAAEIAVALAAHPPLPRLSFNGM